MIDSTTLLAQLREDTASDHQRLEQTLNLVSPDLTPARYIRILQAFVPFFEPWEEALDLWCPQEFGPLWQNRQRCHLLRADLAILGAGTDPRLDLVVPPDELRNPGEWLGSLYVLEGSRLGGQFISRHLEQNFGWQRNVGYSFFSGAGEAPAQHWRTVCNAVQTHANVSNRIIKGAHLTYDYLYQCIVFAL